MKGSIARCTRKRGSGILTSLVAHPDGLKFGELRTLCPLTDGNLSRHLDVLRESGLVEIWKGFEARRPQTLVRLTPTAVAASSRTSKSSSASCATRCRKRKARPPGRSSCRPAGSPHRLTA